MTASPGQATADDREPRRPPVDLVPTHDEIVRAWNPRSTKRPATVEFAQKQSSRTPGTKRMLSSEAGRALSQTRHPIRTARTGTSPAAEARCLGSRRGSRHRRQRRSFIGRRPRGPVRPAHRSTRAIDANSTPGHLTAFVAVLAIVAPAVRAGTKPQVVDLPDEGNRTPMR